ncbi:peptidase, partial [Salmonella enterica subsp. enterica serovar Newport]
MCSSGRRGVKFYGENQRMNSLTVNNRLSQQPGMYEYRPLRHEC